MTFSALHGRHFMYKLSNQAGFRPQKWCHLADKRWNKYTPACFHRKVKTVPISWSIPGDVLLYLPPLNVCCVLCGIQQCRGLLLTVKLSLIIVPCVLYLIGCLPRPFIDLFNWFTFICKAILVPLRYYSCCRISGKLCGNDCLRSQEAVSLSVPEVQTELGRRAFMYSVTSAARKPELNESEMKGLVSLGALKRFQGVLRQPNNDQNILLLICHLRFRSWFLTFHTLMDVTHWYVLNVEAYALWYYNAFIMVSIRFLSLIHNLSRIIGLNGDWNKIICIRPFIATIFFISV